MPPLSKKHHYIPQFYLRGFTDDAGYFTVYDKQLNIFRKSRPENEFYEKFRNTTNLGGEKSVIVEEIYSHFESNFASTVAAIEKSSHTDSIITAEIIIGVKFFVETMRWRNPALDDVYKKVVGMLTIDDFGLSIKGATKKEQAEINKRIMDEPEAQKMLRPFIAAMSLKPSKDDDYYNNSKWHILYQDGGFPITGDFPIIFNPKTLQNGLDEEFIFPLSAQRTVVVSNIKPAKQLPNAFSVDKDLAIIHLAKRFVCCKHDEYLKYMINYYKTNQSMINDSFIANTFLELATGA